MPNQVTVTPSPPFQVMPVVQDGNQIDIVLEAPSQIVISTVVPPTSADSRYHYRQNVLSDTWAIFHGLQKYVSVDIVDDAGKNIEAHVTRPDVNNVIIYFSQPLTGDVFFN